ncbi:MFS transporter [Kribbella sp. NPDC051952]|uniref:MFS transporter n=1 Tax=Kribbella sp. NPDC051952 TaxID=3154851 RepID=UPI00341B0D45
MPLSSFRTPKLWADRDFLRLWIGQTASQLASFASQVTLPLVAVTALGAGAAQLGVLRAVQQVPILLFSLFVGVLVDRWRARSVMMYADLGRAVMLALVPIAWMLGMPFLYLVAFNVGMFTVCFDVAYQASLPRLVARDQLAQGNSMLETTRSAAQICGPALGGALVSVLTAPIAVLASAVMFAASSVSIGRIRGLRGAVSASSGGVLGQIREGLRIVVHDGSLRAIAAGTCAYQFSFTALTTVQLLFLTRALNLPAAVVGLVLAAFGPGVLIGSLLSAWLPRRFGFGRVVVLAALIADLVMLCTAAVHGSGPWTVAALITINVLYGVFSQTVDVVVTAIRQAITPLEVQGRVVATINFLGLGLTPFGALLGGAAAATLGIRTALVIAVLGLFLSPLALKLSPLGRGRMWVATTREG